MSEKKSTLSLFNQQTGPRQAGWDRDWWLRDVARRFGASEEEAGRILNRVEEKLASLEMSTVTMPLVEGLVQSAAIQLGFSAGTGETDIDCGSRRRPGNAVLGPQV